MNADTTVTTHKNVRVVEIWGARFVCEAIVNKDLRSVTILCAPALIRIAGTLAERVLAENGWRPDGGSASSFGTGHARTADISTGQGRWRESRTAH